MHPTTPTTTDALEVTIIQLTAAAAREHRKAIAQLHAFRVAVTSPLSSLADVCGPIGQYRKALAAEAAFRRDAIHYTRFLRARQANKSRTTPTP